ncbi:MAG TPA: rod shape-determining protein [Cellvibrionaceae bacterium]
MLKQLFAHFFDAILYVQISSEKLNVVDVKTGQKFAQPPFIAIEQSPSGKRTIKAVGSDAKLLTGVAGFEVENPFLHPRQLIANFQKAEKIMQHAFRIACSKGLFTVSPMVVLQPMEKLDGGLTDVEIRAFRELCLGAGAREVVIYIGTDLLISNFDFEAIKRQGI